MTNEAKYLGIYEDLQHARDCAVLYWQIIENSIGAGRHIKTPHILAANYAAFWSACQDAKFDPLAFGSAWRHTVCQVAAHETERAAFHSATGKVFLPLACYFDAEHCVDDWTPLLPKDVQPYVSQLYAYTRTQRQEFMRQTADLYQAWRDGGQPALREVG